MVSFRAITEDNFDAIINMKRPEGEDYVAPNAVSLAQAWLYRDAGDVFPFAIYDGDTPVGFMLLDEDAEERTLAIWRILLPPEHQNKGYGSAALGRIIELARESGKYDYLIIDCKPGNDIALHVYKKLGFRETGEISNGEIVLEYHFE